MSENLNYYISTGAKECYYTLRYRFTETVWFRTEIGAESRVVERDYHVQNLSTDRDEAIAKARTITGRGLSAEFEVRDITRRQDIDWSIFQAGKYEGKSIHEVAAADRQYLVWLCENMPNSDRYKKTVELARALVAHELAANEAARTEAKAQQERKATEQREKLKDIIAILKAQAPGGFCESVALDLEAGRDIAEKAKMIVCDIFGKASGRRNSKAYNAAWDRAAELLRGN